MTSRCRLVTLYVCVACVFLPLDKGSGTNTPTAPTGAARMGTRPRYISLVRQICFSMFLLPPSKTQGRVAISLHSLTLEEQCSNAETSLGQDVLCMESWALASRRNLASADSAVFVHYALARRHGTCSQRRGGPGSTTQLGCVWAAISGLGARSPRGIWLGSDYWQQEARPCRWWRSSGHPGTYDPTSHVAGICTERCAMRLSVNRLFEAVPICGSFSVDLAKMGPMIVLRR